MAKAFLLLVCLSLATGVYLLAPRKTAALAPAAPARPAAIKKDKEAHLERVRMKAAQLKSYAAKKGFAQNIAFFIDMRLHSGKKRFFIYNLQEDSILHAGLVAHGSCNAYFLEDAAFSNKEGSGCSSLGKYKVSYAYRGNFGKSYKLAGLDASNNNAFERYVVLHAYDCVPDEETFPDPVCNSRGCPMVSYAFRDTLASYIDRSGKPVLLWIYQ